MTPYVKPSTFIMASWRTLCAPKKMNIPTVRMANCCVLSRSSNEPDHSFSASRDRFLDDRLSVCWSCREISEAFTKSLDASIISTSTSRGLCPCVGWTAAAGRSGRHMMCYKLRCENAKMAKKRRNRARRSLLGWSVGWGEKCWVQEEEEVHRESRKGGVIVGRSVSERNCL